MKTRVRSFLRASALLLAIGSLPASAATVSISRSAEQPINTQWNLTTYGEVDWAVWKKTGIATGNAVATNSKLNATSVSDLFLVGGTSPNFQASTNSVTDWDFSFTDGTSPTNSTVTDANGVFNSTLAQKGSGIGVSVVLPTTGIYQITLWASGFSLANGLLSASMPGASTSNNGLADEGLDAKDMWVYTITAQADTAGDAVSLTLINDDGAPNPGPNPSSHVIINAVAISLIPEPSALALASLGLLGLLRRRR